MPSSCSSLFCSPRYCDDELLLEVEKKRIGMVVLLSSCIPTLSLYQTSWFDLFGIKGKNKLRRAYKNVMWIPIHFGLCKTVMWICKWLHEGWWCFANSALSWRFYWKSIELQSFIHSFLRTDWLTVEEERPNWKIFNSLSPCRAVIKCKAKDDDTGFSFGK